MSINAKKRLLIILMTFLIFASLVLTASCLATGMKQFRVKNGTINIGEFEYENVSGTLVYQFSPEQSASQVGFVGMTMDTLFPVMFATAVKPEAENGFEMEYECGYGIIRKQGSSMTGKTKFRGNWDNAELIGNCRLPYDQPCTFKLTGNKSEHLYYDMKEAGMRAKILIGSTSTDFGPSDLIGYAIMDSFYTYLSCEYFLLEQFPPINGPAPGAIIVGKDGKHCAILDNEGTKFIHSNFIKGEVTIESIATISRYFPQGVHYKAYPDM